MWKIPPHPLTLRQSAAVVVGGVSDTHMAMRIKMIKAGLERLV
jgi:hypothetical protein